MLSSPQRSSAGVDVNVDVHKFFSPADLAEIESAVKAAERVTSGEIVPYAVASCDHYDGATWKAAALGALLASLGAALAYDLGGFWGRGLALWIAAPPIVGAALGYLAAGLIPPFKRVLVHAHEFTHQVERRAAAAFLEQEVFATAERTGILVFVAVFERRVVVLADSGINAKVEQGEWDGIVAEIVAGIRSGRPGKALADAIRRCGELLARHHVERRPGDRDELSDEMRLREE